MRNRIDRLSGRLNAEWARLRPRETLYRILVPGAPVVAGGRRMTEEHARQHGRLTIPDEDERERAGT